MRSILEISESARHWLGDLQEELAAWTLALLLFALSLLPLLVLGGLFWALLLTTP